MFQHFELRAERDKTAQRLRELRQEMTRHELSAYLVPHSDEQQNEYLPPHAERLSWLTAFTGSAGAAVVTMDQAVLFVDGRYSLQASAQVDGDAISIDSLMDNPPDKWIASHAGAGWRIGYDPALQTIAAEERLLKATESVGARLVPVPNLIDRIWADRPALPSGKVRIQDLRYAGMAAIEKLEQISASLQSTDGCMLTDPASIAWAFNIRGNDIAHIPIALSWALLRKDERPLLFIDSAKLGRKVRAYLTQLADLREPDDLTAELAAWAKDRKIACDRDRVSAGLAALIRESGGEVIAARDPVILPRAIKNDAEIAGARDAQLRDGVAVTRFLAWLDRQPAGSITEIAAARALEQFRSTVAQSFQSSLEEISFDTISGAGAHGAIVHYRVTTETDIPLLSDTLYLVDSGGQYPDGTTDITRTVAIGTPPALACEDFTLVLKGHIAIATARFPVGTRGMDIDPLARIALWKGGRDYAHGTGHGIGAFLSVHEGPQSISRRGSEPLVAGMIVSNEPGFYRDGQWGIRIENLVLVRPAVTLDKGNVAVHEFETLTLAPIDRRLILADWLTAEEREWLDTYHARVENLIGAHLDEADRYWLAQACAPLQ